MLGLRNQSKSILKLIIEFMVIFILLHVGCSKSDLPSMSEVLDFLSVPHYPQKHWSISIGWDMVE